MFSKDFNLRELAASVGRSMKPTVLVFRGFCACSHFSCYLFPIGTTFRTGGLRLQVLLGLLDGLLLGRARPIPAACCREQIHSARARRQLLLRFNR